MKLSSLYLLCVLSLGAVSLSGCGKPDQKPTQAEQDATKNGMRGNPGDYKAAPLNTSMTPRATPKPTEEAK